MKPARAGLWRRVAAAWIDWSLIYAVSSVVIAAARLASIRVSLGHLERCDQCGHERNAYNSCADRHCPKCQSFARAKWLEKRQAELLDCEYFHVVFTPPAELATLALQNKRLMYDLLFRATAATLQSVAADPQYLGAQIGFFCILHSWGQTLNWHPRPQYPECGNYGC